MSDEEIKNGTDQPNTLSDVLEKEIKFSSWQENLTIFYQNARSFHLAFTELSDLIAKTDAFRKWQEGIRLFNSDKVQAAVRAFAETLLAQEKLSARLKEDEIFLTPFLLQKTISEIGLLSSSQSPIVVLDEFFSKASTVENLIQFWRKSAPHHEREEILREALDAHLNKKFAISIPIFLVHIEGILNEVLGLNYTRVKPPRRKMEVDNLEYFYGMAAIEILWNTIFQSSNRSPNYENAKFPNRHKILHGNDLSYYKVKFASTRCIILLDFLSEKQNLDGLRLSGDDLDSLV